MECAVTDEAMDAGGNSLEVLDLDQLVSLYGDCIDSLEYASELALDNAATQESSLAPPPQN
jgi:predicted HTH domain antitoxin